MAVVPVGHPLAALDRPLTPQDFEGQAVIGYHPEQSRYFHELSVRFLANAHPRIEQRVHQVLTAILLVAADRGLALAPASATSSRSRGSSGARARRWRHQARRRSRAAVELHAIWARGGVTPVVRRVLDGHLGRRLAGP